MASATASSPIAKSSGSELLLRVAFQLSPASEDADKAAPEAGCARGLGRARPSAAVTIAPSGVVPTKSVAPMYATLSSQRWALKHVLAPPRPLPTKACRGGRVAQCVLADDASQGVALKPRKLSQFPHLLKLKRRAAD